MKKIERTTTGDAYQDYTNLLCKDIYEKTEEITRLKDEIKKLREVIFTTPVGNEIMRLKKENEELRRKNEVQKERLSACVKVLRGCGWLTDDSTKTDERYESGEPEEGSSGGKDSCTDTKGRKDCETQEIPQSGGGKTCPPKPDELKDPLLKSWAEKIRKGN